MRAASSVGNMSRRGARAQRKRVQRTVRETPYLRRGTVDPRCSLNQMCTVNVSDVAARTRVFVWTSDEPTRARQGATRERTIVGDEERMAGGQQVAGRGNGGMISRLEHFLDAGT